jgi:hypothetical protein
LSSARQGDAKVTNWESGQIPLGPFGTGLFIVHPIPPSICTVFRAHSEVRCCNTPKLICIDPWEPITWFYWTCSVLASTSIPHPDRIRHSIYHLGNWTEVYCGNELCDKKGKVCRCDWHGRRQGCSGKIWAYFRVYGPPDKLEIVLSLILFGWAHCSPGIELKPEPCDGTVSETLSVYSVNLTNQLKAPLN